MSVYHRASAGVYVVSGVPWEFGTNAAPPHAADWWVLVGSEQPFWTPCMHSVMTEVKGQHWRHCQRIDAVQQQAQHAKMNTIHYSFWSTKEVQSHLNTIFVVNIYDLYSGFLVRLLSDLVWILRDPLTAIIARKICLILKVVSSWLFFFQFVRTVTSILPKVWS